MPRPVVGAALLVAGHGAIGGTALDASAVHTLGQIGEALLATGAGWQLRRLSAAAGERLRADRGTLKHHVDELVGEPLEVAVLVMLGVIADVGGPALVTSSQLREYPEDATLPLAWLGERLRAIRAKQLLVVMNARRDPAFAASVGGSAAGSPAQWLDVLRTGRPQDVIAIDTTPSGAPIVDALLAALCGDALDPKTGTVTMKSLSDCLARRVPTAAMQISEASQTLAQSPPLAGLWDLRRSQLARPRLPAPGDPDDLTGIVMPGRFELSGIVARGTFGTVYRARQLAVGREVAVKVLNADIDPSSQDGKLFVHEIRAVGRIDHPNVVRIHQADIAPDGRLFYAMELLEGRDLQSLVADGPLAKDRAVELVRQLLVGLGAAHDAGLVHADVKPANAIVVPRDDGERVVLVDFGLARLRAPEDAAESAGGTPAYMAPEQLHEGRVDARSDLFSAALVLVTLLTGWRRPNAFTIVPPLDTIDADLRPVLAKALSVDPAQRYASARELAAALTGSVAPQVTQPVALLPFRLFAPLTEADRSRLSGREADVAALTEHVLYRRSVIYAAPSGTGKTSLLRAGLVPRLEALGVHPVYLRVRTSSAAALAAAIWTGATSVADAVAEHAKQRGTRLVIVLDQVETALGDDELISAVLRLPADADIAIVLSIREDHVARLIARAQRVEPGIPIIRLPPLDIAGARAAIVGPLTEARLAIEPALLEALLTDLRKAAGAIAPEMGWTDAPAVYPPHLQLACSVLVEALEPGEATLTLARYRKLGGFEAIVGEHLERVLDVELAGGRDAIARDVFVGLVTTAHQRAIRPESELLALVKHDRGATLGVLDLLRARGLLVRVRGDAEPSWELVHDSLIPRILSWIDRRDLARRKAVELVRYHLRRSRPDAPSLLSRAELRELRGHEAAIDELDADWRTRTPYATLSPAVLTPSSLVARSRQTLRRRTIAIGAIVTGALATAGVAITANRIADAHERAEQSLRDRDLGRFTLELAPFDWDPQALRAVPVPASQLVLHWELHTPDRDDPDAPGARYEPRYLEAGEPTLGATLRQHVEARGGRAFLVISGRGRPGEACAPSIVPLSNLPGYIHRNEPERTLHIAVPTCQASLADTLAIAAGPFIFGGVGDPPTHQLDEYPELKLEHEIVLPAFRIDRTEVTNAAFAVFAAMKDATGIAAPQFPKTVGYERAADPSRPVAGQTWAEARAYCRFLGKQLPSTQQWERAYRGGLRLADGTPNPRPRRSFPWGEPRTPIPAKLAGTDPEGSAPVGSSAGDVSPDGVVDLAGNVMEWTDTRESADSVFRITRGGDWTHTSSTNVLDYVGVQNQRASYFREFTLGMRCVVP
jgi:formylglycine-generating enzyme required for sulfatase activity